MGQTGRQASERPSKLQCLMQSAHPDMEHIVAKMRKATLKAEDNETICVPRLQSRSVAVVCRLLEDGGHLANDINVSCNHASFLKDGWGEVAFHDFFEKQYLYKARVSEQTFVAFFNSCIL